MRASIGMEQASVRTEDTVMPGVAPKGAETFVAPGDVGFRALIEASRDAISVSVDDRHVFVNPAYVAMFGYQGADEILGLPIWSVVAPSQRDAVIERSRRRREGYDEPSEYQIEGVRKDGATFFFEARVSTFQNGGALHTLVVCRDVTEALSQQKALQEAEERLRLATEGARVGTWHWDMKTGELEWSTLLKESYGLAPDARVTFEQFESMLHPDDRATVRESLLRASESHEDLKIDFRATRSDGEERWFEALGRASYGADGIAERFVGIAFDITDRKDAEEYVYRLNSILEKRVQERTEEMEAFTYSVSHDLRAPLRAIMSTSMILLEDYGAKLGPEGTDHLNRQAAAAKRLGDLIDDLLGLSRIGRSAIHPIEFDISWLAEDVARELEQRPWGYPVKVQVAPGMLANGDPRLLRYALQNLIENALKFARPRAGVHVEIGCMAEPNVFFVRDDGIGFDMQYIDKIFRPFERLHRDSEYTGTGIGLASVQRIIQRHGGSVWAESQVGRGSTFYFSL